MDGVGSGSWPVASFGVVGIESADSATGELVTQVTGNTPIV